MTTGTAKTWMITGIILDLKEIIYEIINNKYKKIIIIKKNKKKLIKLGEHDQK